MKISSSDLIAFNSYGGFSQDKDEYHILNANTPLPWCNVLANPNFGSIISDKGTVYSYFKNSREFKLTNWNNDWVDFKAGEYFKGIFENTDDYDITFGFGYVKVKEQTDTFKKDMDIFVDITNNIKVHYITIENLTESKQNLEIKYILDPVLGVSKDETADYILCRQINDKMCIKNPYISDFSDCVAYSYVVCDSDQEKVNYDISNYTTEVSLNLKPKSKLSFAIILGAYDSKTEDIDDEINKYNSIEKLCLLYQNTKKYWKDLVVKDFSTGDIYIDIMADGWLLYQTVVCRLYARSAFYQSGGAIGFRDQLQDSLALIRTRPEMTRNQILLHASKQFEKGDVLHWWHPHNKAGIRTYFSDDYLWLPYVVSEYVNITSDTSILYQETNFLEDKPMGNFRQLYSIFENIDKKASVYEHCKKAILYGLSRYNEKNGLLDIGDGDWNDGFSNIRGQSVWLSLFMMDILDRFDKITKIVNDDEMNKLCMQKRHILKHNIIENAWDQDHFVRAFYSNGEVLGANKNKECKIDLISQTWAAIALKSYPDAKNEIETCLKTVDKYLVDRENNIVSLLYPPFNKPKNDPGYIKAYVPGTRENGGQYTHASTWLAKAYFEIGNYDKAMEILKMLNPIAHSDTKQKADVYMVEPYVIVADIYTNPEHIGRGGWTWYTGSAAWYYKIIEDYVKKDVQKKD